MKKKIIILMLNLVSLPVLAASDSSTNAALLLQIKQLQAQTDALQKQLTSLQKQVAVHPHKAQKSLQRHPQGAAPKAAKASRSKPVAPKTDHHEHAYQSSLLSIHVPSEQGLSPRYYPTALVADNKIITYIAGTPVVTSPYTGDRPAFDGSDYIVNISSINRDLRLMEQRRRFYQAYQDIGYPAPKIPIIALSGKAEPVAVFSNPYNGHSSNDLSLGSSEIDVAAALNHYVEAFFSIAYDDSPPDNGGPRVSNSSFDLNLGFVNIGDPDVTPIYFTAGQLYAPFGKYSSSMVSSPLALTLARTKTRPFILGYKSQGASGLYAAGYGFMSDTASNDSNIGGVNLGYTFSKPSLSGDIGAGFIGTIADSGGMQATGSAPYTTFGGFGSITNGSEAIGRVPALDIHGNISFARYSLTAEWVSTTRAFTMQDLSFNAQGARPQAGQLEAGVTFIAWDKPASLAASYQWTKEALALNLPEQRMSAVFNISIWKDTVESLEYHHDRDYAAGTFANGANAPGQLNANTLGTGKSADTVVAQIGVYF